MEAYEIYTLADRNFIVGDLVKISYDNRWIRGKVVGRRPKGFDFDGAEKLTVVDAEGEGLLFGLASEGYIRFLSESMGGNPLYRMRQRRLTEEEIRDRELTNPF